MEIVIIASHWLQNTNKKWKKERKKRIIFFLIWLRPSKRELVRALTRTMWITIYVIIAPTLKTDGVEFFFSFLSFSSFHRCECIAMWRCKIECHLHFELIRKCVRVHIEISRLIVGNVLFVTIVRWIRRHSVNITSPHQTLSATTIVNYHLHPISFTLCTCRLRSSMCVCVFACLVWWHRPHWDLTESFVQSIDCFSLFNSYFLFARVCQFFLFVLVPLHIRRRQLASTTLFSIEIERKWSNTLSLPFDVARCRFNSGFKNGFWCWCRYRVNALTIAFVERMNWVRDMIFFVFVALKIDDNVWLTSTYCRCSERLRPTSFVLCIFFCCCCFVLERHKKKIESTFVSAWMLSLLFFRLCRRRARKVMKIQENWNAMFVPIERQMKINKRKSNERIIIKCMCVSVSPRSGRSRSARNFSNENSIKLRLIHFGSVLFYFPRTLFPLTMTMSLSFSVAFVVLLTLPLTHC